MSDTSASGPLHLSPFEAIRRIAEEGQEYWSARELGKLLGYTEYRKFKNAIQKAEIACENSGQVVVDHFAHVSEMVAIGSGAKRGVEDVFLSRYACYLLVENADPSKPIVALGQAYFAVQTRRQELADLELTTLPEDQKRLILRSEMSIFNSKLAEAAQAAGVIEALDFAIFQDHGYKGLYGLKAQEIHARKGLKKGQHILDFMGSEELASNIFRAAQTDAKLRRDQVQGKEEANRTHYQVGSEVRRTIQRLGGTTPENLPTPKESIKELEQKERKRLKPGPEEKEQQ